MHGGMHCPIIPIVGSTYASTSFVVNLDHAAVANTATYPTEEEEEEEE